MYKFLSPLITLAPSPRGPVPAAPLTSHTLGSLTGCTGIKGLWCLTLPLCFRGQVLPAASLLNIVDVELIYEGVKYVLQVRAVLCSSGAGCSTRWHHRLLPRTRTCASVLPRGERCNKYEAVL